MTSVISSLLVDCMLSGPFPLSMKEWQRSSMQVGGQQIYQQGWSVEIFMEGYPFCEGGGLLSSEPDDH